MFNPTSSLVNAPEEIIETQSAGTIATDLVIITL